MASRDGVIGAGVAGDDHAGGGEWDDGAVGGEAVLLAKLSRRLREAHRRVRELSADEETRRAALRRLIAITNAAKHDLVRASRRLDALLVDLDKEHYRVDIGR